MTADARDPRRVPLAPLLLVNFIGTLGFSIVLPFLIFLVEDFGGNAVVYGLVGATYPAFQFFGAPVLGRWSDRYGRRRILLVSQVGTLLAWVVFGAALWLPVTTLGAAQLPGIGRVELTWPLLLVFAARALDGLTGGNVSVANAYVADISDDENRARNFGRMGVAANVGMVFGPAIASLLGLMAHGERYTVLAAVLISLVAAVTIAVALPESRPAPASAPGRDASDDAEPPASEPPSTSATSGHEPRACVDPREAASPARSSALARPWVPLLLGLYFAVMLAFSVFYASFPVHASQGLGWTQVENGIFFAVLSAALALVEGPVLGWLSGRVRAARLVSVGCVILAGNFALMQSTSTLWVFVAAGLFALGNGIMWPSLVAIVADAAGRRKQGAVQGLAGSASSLASIVGLVAGGVVFAVLGAQTFWVPAGLSLACAIAALPLLRREPTRSRD